MIQLANDPNASRAFPPPSREDAKPSATHDRPIRSGHAWPFLSRYAARPAQPQSPKPAASDSGS
jgi:hypothetical protein